jgi:hypothetical protein
MKRLAIFLTLLFSALIAHGQFAPSAVTDSIFSIVITRGTYPMATSGSVVRLFNSTGTYNDIIASPEVGLSSGTFVYTKTGDNTGKVVFTSTDIPTNTAALTFTSATGGTYTLSVGGYSNMQSGTFALIETAPPMVNVSTRVTLAGGQKATAGFVIHGTTPRTVLLRAVGPGLADYGVPLYVKDPKVELFTGSTKLQSNDNWTADATLISESTRVGAFALKASSKDSAMIATLQPGNYTIEGSATTNTDTGDILLEVYLLQ